MNRRKDPQRPARSGSGSGPGAEASRQEAGSGASAATRRRRRSLDVATAGTAAGLGALLAAPAGAAIITVDSLADVVADDGECTLREALTAANTDTASGVTAGECAAGDPTPTAIDLVTFQLGLTGTIGLASGQLEVLDSVTIQGPGPALLAVSGNDASRVLYLYSPSAVLDVSISGLTLTGGSAAEGAGIADFGENLTLVDVVIEQNHASTVGGGLYASGFAMRLTIRDSVVSGNTASAFGGGIMVEDTGAPLLIERTRIAGNSAGLAGGGLHLYDPDHDVTIVESSISGNSAGFAGGGIYLYGVSGGGSATIERSTISGNDAVLGGGLAVIYGSLLIESSTISGNDATAGDGGGAYFYYTDQVTIRHSTVAGNSAGGGGGGLFVAYDSGEVELDHVIVADNSATSDDDLCGDGGYRARFSLIEQPGSANLTDLGGNVFGQDPQLAPLADNGGPTETHLPASASPAVDGGDPAFAPPPLTDQRGNGRVADGNGDAAAAIDMGAVELHPGTLQLDPVALSVAESAGTVTLTATRTGGADGEVCADYATADGTAVDPDDYLAAAGRLTWANQDATAKTFQVTVVADSVDEADETFTAALSLLSGGAVLGAGEVATVTILDDDVGGALRFAIADYSVQEHGVTVTLSVERVGGSNGAVSVQYESADGSATAPADYGAAAGTLSWGDGDVAPKTFQVTIVDDLLFEGDETFAVALSDPAGGAVLGSPSTATVTILDNERFLQEIPTLDEWARLLLAALLGGAAAGALRRRRLAPPAP